MKACVFDLRATTAWPDLRLDLRFLRKNYINSPAELIMVSFRLSLISVLLIFEINMISQKEIFNFGHLPFLKKWDR